MYVTFYTLTFAVSVLLLLLYVLIWKKHFDVHITVFFVLTPIINLGYVMLAHAATLREAIAANRLTFLGGCFLIMDIVLIVFSMCGFRLKRWLRTLMVAASLVVYAMTLTIGQSDLFYKSISFEKAGSSGYLIKEYNTLHTIFYVYDILCFAVTIAAIIYSYYRKRQVSRKTILLLFLPLVVAMLCFFVIRKHFYPLELIPAAYDFAMLMYLIIVHRVSLYDINDTAVDSLVDEGTTGLVSFDLRYNYLASNGTAKQIMPVLRELTVDHPIHGVPELEQTALRWLKLFRDDESKDTALYKSGERIYLVNIRYLSDGRRKRGYQLFLTDDTRTQNYQADLKAEVAQKTAHIVEMHNNLVLSMATMVESRDNSTGGHIRRTSELVRILVGKINEDPAVSLPAEFCRNIVKAAPMHDLGKIAVDDAVLRKPGRFTPEEFEKMKAHAAEGARIVHEILKDTDDNDFHILAENVAHYHHERWDGSGYPEGLKGEEIPLEARIMAIADVYDALVSKRVYKESMSFEQADSIIMEGMGKHFDKQLEPYYIAARPEFESYYRSLA
ncbi:MAG: HD domain-containing protein [Oscillospiraceae bacterium]|nr:HD domain-containing protein [Oscillospiraceae bacterium]